MRKMVLCNSNGKQKPYTSPTPDSLRKGGGMEEGVEWARIEVYGKYFHWAISLSQGGSKICYCTCFTLNVFEYHINAFIKDLSYNPKMQLKVCLSQV